MAGRQLSTPLLAAFIFALAACSPAGDTGQRAGSSADSAHVGQRAAAVGPRYGGEATVLLGSDFAGAWPTGLDPASNVTGGANLSLMNAIFGGLFQLTADADGSHVSVIGVLASGYDIADSGRTVVIHIRPGVVFSDGTPFDAGAVQASMLRNLQSGCSCAPVSWPWTATNPITRTDDHTVELHFSRPYAAVMNNIPASNLNWIASPAAYTRLGERFREAPVGAGPFRVVKAQLSSRLELERNPRYWEPGRPYLDRLVFQSIGSEQAAYQAILAGDARAYEGMTSPVLIRQAQANKKLSVITQPATSTGVVQLNMTIAPFSDQRAREAVYYATDAEAIRAGLYGAGYAVTQSFTAPGGLFYHLTVPGYRTYDLQKAQAIVKQLGGLRVTLGTLKTPAAEQLITALQTQWQRAGIQVELQTYDLGNLIKVFQGHQWQALLQTAGSYDPDAGSGLNFRFGSGAPLSGIRDSHLDELIKQAAGSLDAQQRDGLYVQAAEYISEKAYAPFLVTQVPAQVVRGIHGPGLTTKTPPILVDSAILWQDVWVDPP